MIVKWNGKIVAHKLLPKKANQKALINRLKIPVAKPCCGK